MWIVDPKTKAPLPALDSEQRYLERRRQQVMAPRFVPERENGIIVRLRWVDPTQRQP